MKIKQLKRGIALLIVIASLLALCACKKPEPVSTDEAYEQLKTAAMTTVETNELYITIQGNVTYTTTEESSEENTNQTTTETSTIDIVFQIKTDENNKITERCIWIKLLDEDGSGLILEGYYKDLKGSISNLDFVTKDQLDSAIYNAKEELKTATQNLVTLSLKTYLGIQWSMFPNSATETFNVKRPGLCAIGIIGVDCENYNNVHYCNLHLYVSSDHSVQEVHTRVVDANGNKVSNAGVRFGILYMANTEMNFILI